MSNQAQPVAIRRRIVLHLGGYDIAEPAEQHRLFTRELARFGRTWSVQATAGPAPEIAGPIARWNVTTAGPGWRCETSYRVLRWDDIVSRELARGHPGRLVRAALAFADFVGTGTVFRYLRISWPFTLYFCFPFATLALFLVTSSAAGLWISGWTGLLTGTGLFTALYLGPGRWWRVPQALDYWIFSREHVRARRPETARRLEEFTDALLAAANDPEADEVLLVGHSFGATLALELLVRALARQPGLGTGRTAVGLLTVGAAIPQLALHPRGANVRACAATVAASAAVDWAEYQACDDPISFYKVDPVALQRRRDYPPGSRPMVRRVHARDMLAAATYHRFRHRWVRLHYQFLMANDVRARYDFYMFACGPVPFRHLVAAHGGPLDFFSANGSRMTGAVAAATP
jgi:pimeloyl-ACP methyl ester carboxylesterase